MESEVSRDAFPVQHGEIDELDVAPRTYSERLPAGEPRRCGQCGRAIDPRSKRHTCAACTMRKCRGAQTGEACEACGHGDRRVLRILRLADRSITACGNCTALAGRRAITVEQLRAELGEVAAA